MTADELRREIGDITERLATTPTMEGSGAQSVDHCTLQCDFWRKTFALASMEMASINDKTRSQARHMLGVSSKEAERWEGRRQQALRIQKADDLAECRRMMEELMSQGAAFEGLAD